VSGAYLFETPLLLRIAVEHHALATTGLVARAIMLTGISGHQPIMDCIQQEFNLLPLVYLLTFTVGFLLNLEGAFDEKLRYNASIASIKSQYEFARNRRMELVKQLREDRKQAWKEDAMTAEKIRKADAIAD
jgi:hypothetical protein